MFKWLFQPQAIEMIEPDLPEIVYVVEPHMGHRQLEKIKKHVDMTKYQVGDSIESVAYRQGQIDLCNFIHKQIIGGKL